MKICIIAEGAYPYVSGGVSNWIHTIIHSMPEVEFTIYAIGAERKQQGKFKYEFPQNLVEVHEVFLDTHLEQTSNWGKRYLISSNDKENLYALVSGDSTVNWQQLFTLLRSEQFQNVGEFLSSKDYFDIIQELARTKYTQVPFTELFWTVGSMILPLFLIIRDDIPKADIYHSVSTGYAGVAGSLAKILYKKPLILTEHGIYSREREEEIIKANWVKGYFKDLWINYFYTLSGSIYNLSDEVITLFNRNKEIEIELGCDANKISIIPNGIEIQEYRNIIRSLPEDKIRIGAIVRIVPIKDIKMMIQAFALVEQKIPNSELYILGPQEEDSEYYKECVQLVRNLGVKNVQFTGMVNVKEYIGNLDILLLTSISEGQPLAILEGFACAKPFVSTNVGGCKELIEGINDDFGPAGFVVPVMHYEEMANQIIKLCKNPEMRNEMGENGRRRVTHLYKKSDFIDSYKNIYTRVGGAV